MLKPELYKNKTHSHYDVLHGNEARLKYGSEDFYLLDPVFHDFFGVCLIQ